MTTTITGIQRARVILNDLLRDNADFISGDSKSQAEMSSASVRSHLSENGQAPVAAIVACADSRVAPEIVFSAGIGKLFVIRNAGNIVSEKSVLASLEFAICSLHVPLVVILGHSKCGAITAAVQAAKANGDVAPAPGKTPLIDYVTELSKIVKSDVGSPEELKDAILSNVRHGVNTLKHNPTPIADAYSQGSVEIVGALYDIHSGEVFVVDQ